MTKKTIHIHLHRTPAKARDAGWDESKHKRNHGQFSSTGGSSGSGVEVKHQPHGTVVPHQAPKAAAPDDHKAKLAAFGKMLGGALKAQEDRPGGAPGATHRGTAPSHSPVNSKAGVGTQTHHSLIKPGDSLHDKNGQKIDHVESIGKAMHAGERTIHTRAGYQHQTKGGHLPDGMHAKASSYTEK